MRRRIRSTPCPDPVPDGFSQGRFKNSVEGKDLRELHLDLLGRFVRDLHRGALADEMLAADPHYSGYFDTTSPTSRDVKKSIDLLTQLGLSGKSLELFRERLSEIAGLSQDTEVRDAARVALIACKE